MFHLCGCCSEKSVSVIEFVGNKSQQIPCSPRSVIPEAPPVNTKTDAKIPLRHRIFGRPLSKETPAQNEQSIPAANKKPSKRPQKCRWWHSRMKRCKVSPTDTDKSVKESQPPPHQDATVNLKDQIKKEERPNDKNVPPHRTRRDTKVSTNKLQRFRCLGFPNPAQICYMNSCLQSLLTLQDFIRDISRQEQVWSLDPDVTIIRTLMDIRASHSSINGAHKIHLLGAFKRAVSLWNPEFKDLLQKDAHEFLTSVLHQLRTVGQQMQVLGSSMGRTYSCPVEDHLVFKIQNTRKCKGCRAQSSREEEFTNLSLDLIPGGGSVQQMLEHNLKDIKLEYNCKCGATTSSQSSKLVNLPRLLVLHLKRFRFSPTLQLTKNHDPLILSRELVVPSKQGAGCYSLLSTISHIGNTATSGHYISDGVDPDVTQEEVTDRWFTYNDSAVTETCGATVCEQRKSTSYILFYKRQD